MAVVAEHPDAGRTAELTIALSLAKSLHCERQRFDFCDDCSGCAQVADGNCPDMHRIEARAGKKEITINQIRDLIGKISLRSFSGRPKIALLDPAELMNYHAQNALLKTLEEPPHNSILFLIATSSGALLPTRIAADRPLRRPARPARCHVAAIVPG